MIPTEEGCTVFIVARPQIAEDVDLADPLEVHDRTARAWFRLHRSATRCAVPCCRRIPGAAISSVPHRRRAARVRHDPREVTEDVTDIILNLKELVVRSDLDEPTTIYLKAKGPGEVTAGDVAPPAGDRDPEPRPPHRHASARAARSRWR